MKKSAIILLIAVFSSAMLISNEHDNPNYILKKMQKDELTKIDKTNKLKPNIFTQKISMGLLKEKPKTPDFEALSGDRNQLKKDKGAKINKLKPKPELKK